MSSTQTKLVKDERAISASNSPSLQPLKLGSSRPSSSSSSRSHSFSDTSTKFTSKSRRGVTSKTKSSPPPKMARSTSKKSAARSVALFQDLPDSTMEAKSAFTVMESCTYTNRFLGYTEHAMECDCHEEWDSATRKNVACGEDSDCINRATKMECVGDCGCGSNCQNQRFQQRQYANVSVIKTEKKGYGLRANRDLRPGDFIFEYIGEVINEGQFRRRMVQYDEEGIIHFYFMSLSKGEFVDATRKGNLGRFCNHSCNPNCYVDKWVVGDKLRMGIFAERDVQAGEELVFNYNVDRYGANPQPCYCGETNCTGFIGGKTQTERATKLSTATIEALGIDDGDGWDTSVAKKPRKKKAAEDDEDYVDSVEAKSLDGDGVTKVMAALMQCKEKWIAVKLLERIQKAEDEQVRNRVIKLHGYQILNSQLAAWKEDANVILQILDILDQFPRLTRNKIQDSKIEATLEKFVNNDDGRVVSQAKRLLDEWSKLEVAYRIPRKKRDPTENVSSTRPEAYHYERREVVQERKRSRSRTRSRSPPRGPSAGSAPTGPRSSMPQRGAFSGRPRATPYDDLPFGWVEEKTREGRTYYWGVDKSSWQKPTHYNHAFLPHPQLVHLDNPEVKASVEAQHNYPIAHGWWQAVCAVNSIPYYYSWNITRWTRPQIAADPPPPPLEMHDIKVNQAAALKSVISNIVAAQEKEKAAREAKLATPEPVPSKTKDKKVEKWRSYDEEKKKKLYKVTLHPLICYVMNKYKSKIPRDDLKRFAKDIAEKLVNSDFKAGRVQDPTKIDSKHEKKVKKFCQEFFDKAAYKHRKYQKEKAAKKQKEGSSKGRGPNDTRASSKTKSADDSIETPPLDEAGNSDDDADIKMSDNEDDMPTPPSPMESLDGHKRKRDDDYEESKAGIEFSGSPAKRMKSLSPSHLHNGPIDTPPINSIEASPTHTPKRKRNGFADDNIKLEYFTASPIKRIKSETPPPKARVDTMMRTRNTTSSTASPKRKCERDDDASYIKHEESATPGSPAKRLGAPSSPSPSLEHGITDSLIHDHSNATVAANGPDVELHADTSFAQKSMADVLAEAQQDAGTPSDGGEGADADASMVEANRSFAEDGMRS